MEILEYLLVTVNGFPLFSYLSNNNSSNIIDNVCNILAILLLCVSRICSVSPKERLRQR